MIHQKLKKAGIAVLVTTGFLVSFNLSSNIKSSRFESKRDFQISLNKIAQQQQRNEMMKPKDRQRGTEAGELVRTDSPELFAKYQIEIRTRNGEERPTYSHNYAINELLKAKSIHSTKELKRNSIKAGYNWIERGPGNISGRTRVIVADPDDATASTWFVGSVGGGVWKTTNAGSSWINSTPNLPNLATSTIGMCESNPDVIYVGTGEGFGNVDQIDGSGIWKSTDRGETWVQLAATVDPSKFRNITRIVVDPNNADVVIASSVLGFNGTGVSSAIYKSVDGGTTWNNVYSGGGADIQQIVADPNDFNILYATVEGVGVVKSINAGDSWVSKSNGIAGVSRMEMTVSPVDSKRLYISGNGGPVGSTFFYSTDGADTWVKIDNPQYDWLGGQGWYDNTIIAHPFDVDACFVGGINIWRIDVQSDGSIKMTNITDGYRQFGGQKKGVHVDQHYLLCVPTDVANQKYRLINGNDGGVVYSDDEGASFTTTLNGYNTTQFYGIDKKNGADEYIGGMQDNSSWQSPSGASSDSTTAWNFRWGGDGYESAWHYTNPLKILVSSQYNNVGRSLDGGLSFNSAVSDVADVGSGVAPFFTKIAKSKQDPELIFIMGSSGAWRSADFGGNWRLVKLSGAGFGGSSTFSQIKISLADPQVVWVGSNVNATKGLFVSKNGGFNFEVSGGYPDVNMGRITGLATHPTDAATAYATFSFADAPKILKTTNYGDTWEDISGFGTGAESTTGFPDVAVFHLLVMPFNTDIIWAGTEIGIFESVDAGSSWHMLEGNFPAVTVYDMSIVNDQVIVATHGRGIFTTTLPELNGYEPPDVLLAPVLYGVKNNTNGIELDLNLREVYDSSHVLVDGVNVQTLTYSQPTAEKITVNFTPEESKSYTFKVASYSGSRVLETEAFSLELFSFANPVASFASDFKTSNNEFIGEDFTIAPYFGFPSAAIHSKHPYDEAKPISYTLKTPITVAATDAFLAYDDIALIEPGEAGSRFGDSDFYDYVVFQGSTDGRTWKNLSKGYDATAYSDWLDVYNNGGQISILYKPHTINLLNSFNAGDVILIRLYLYSDDLENGWGWAVDNLEIQERLTGVKETEEIPTKFELSQNYPNPFNPSTTIKFSIPQSGNVSLRIYDALGRLVETLVNKEMSDGVYEINWNASNNASGVYYYTLKSGNNISTKKLMLVK